MKLLVVFVSNYINHHQIPFCNRLYEQLGEGFCFIQTQPMEQERVQMGWNSKERLPYVRYYYEQPEACEHLILESKVVLFGGTDEESYISPRLEAGKPVVRYSERLYKTGQWKAISPRGLIRKYHDHTRYRKQQVYLLCAGAYVPSDFHLVRAYTGKMYRWGYFPELKEYDVEELMMQKSGGSTSAKDWVPRILWAARFIDWKHPEIPVRMAAQLKKRGICFRMDMIGGGELDSRIGHLIRELDVEDCVTLLGYKSPGEVRSYMEQADIYLVTSDREEGWGAVVNEAMNSGCAVVANHMIGAVPYLIDPERNGRIYFDKQETMLADMLEELCRNRALCRRLGEEAYRTIAKEWNSAVAAERFLGLLVRLQLLDTSELSGLPCIWENLPADGPCSVAPVISECAMKKLLRKRAQENRRERESCVNRHR